MRIKKYITSEMDLVLVRVLIRGQFLRLIDDVALLELSAVEDPKTHRDDSRREQDRPRNRFAQKYPAIERGEDRAEKADER